MQHMLSIHLRGVADYLDPSDPTSRRARRFVLEQGFYLSFFLWGELASFS